MYIILLSIKSNILIEFKVNWVFSNTFLAFL